MKFQVGDVVVRPALGLCKIIGITRMDLDGKTVEMYELQANEVTVRVPVNQADAGGFRTPLDESGVDDILALMAKPVPPEELQEFTLDVRGSLDLVRQRDMTALANLARMLFNKSKEQDLDKRETELYTACMNCLSEEIALFRRTIKGKITSELKSAMNAARKERRGRGG